MKKLDEIEHKIERSLILTVVGVIILFSLAIMAVVVAPTFVDPSWVESSSVYQEQMYEVSDPNIYINAALPGSEVLQFVRHVKENFTLLSFEELANQRMIAPPDLEKYITKYKEKPLKLTSKLLLLREPVAAKEKDSFDAVATSEQLKKTLQDDWLKEHPKWEDEGLQQPYYSVLELYVPGGTEAFTIADTDGIIENWIDQDFEIIDKISANYQNNPGVLYVKNPQEYRISHLKNGLQQSWQYDPKGRAIQNVEELTSKELGFLSKKELIHMGENIFKAEGCWYCHTIQSRTLVQDCVLNGSDSYPAPPSSANEYIYEEVTFPGTRRIGPDLSRVGVKRSSRDWNKAHFWSPKTKSKGSIMPAFRHFFDNDPRGASKNPYGVPNYRFEAIFQYLMTKGTRITPPNQAWWLGLDPIKTIKIIEGKERGQNGTR